jgi:uncharacterized protein (TIGR02466 family)
MTTRPLFVTPLYEASLSGEKGFEAFVDELHDACVAIAEDDEAGQAWAYNKGYLGYTSYASLNDLPQRDSLFATEQKRLAQMHDTAPPSLPFQEKRYLSLEESAAYTGLSVAYIKRTARGVPAGPHGSLVYRRDVLNKL